MLDKIIKIAEINNNFELIPLIQNAKIDNKIPTFCVKKGSNYIYYNEKFLRSLSLKDAYFIFNHEFLHLVYNHSERSKNHKNKMISNIAADIIVNETLEKLLNTKSPKDSCIRTTEKSTTFETLYQELLKNNNQENKKPNIDDLNTEDESIEESKNESVEESIKKIASKIEELELKEKTIEIKNEENITLFDFLKNKIGKLIKYEHQRNWQRINRYNIECMPNYRHTIYKPKIDIYVDISGSMEEKPLKILENLKTIKKQLKNYKADYFVFNTDIKKIDINNDKINIGGGTDIKKVINNVNSKTDLSIVLTDCEDEYINNNRKIIFVSNNNKADYVCDSDFIKLKR